MAAVMHKPSALAPGTRAFYCRTLTRLSEAGVPFLVGGAYALERHTGIERHTKDLDLFIRRRDYEQLMQVLERSGCRTELPFPHWLGKARCGEDFVDVIFSSGNGVAEVDDEWFAHAKTTEVLGLKTLICPTEEIIWSKAYVMERERFDGADIAHLLRACGTALDWQRLLRRFAADWRVLLSHLVMFDFVYPSERLQIPEWVRSELWRRTQEETRQPAPTEQICRGTLISRAQYLIDIEKWGYRDARLMPGGPMSDEEVARWTAAIDREC